MDGTTVVYQPQITQLLFFYNKFFMYYDNHIVRKRRCAFPGSDRIATGALGARLPNQSSCQGDTMKLSSTGFVLAAGALMTLATAGCESPTMSEVRQELDVSIAQARVGGSVEAPFKANLYTGLAGFAPDPRCGEPPVFLNTQVGEGEATHLGRFTIEIEFCVDATDLLDDGTLTGEESAPYFDGIGVLTAANGDELHMEIVEGAVLPSPGTEFDFEFHDPFSFVGGTGRFVGASGEGITNSVVDQAADVTHHDWRGVLRIPR